jgi:hypothetical protein
MAGFPIKETKEKGERETLTKIFREFKGVNTKADRTAIPPDTFYDLQNLMPIGHANLHSVPNLSFLDGFGVNVIYRAQYANINSIDYLICFATNGNVYAYDINGSATSQINGANTLSGSATKIDQFKNSVILFADSTGYYSWNGASTLIQINIGTNTGILPTGTLVSPDVAVFNNYVWLYSNRILYVSQPNQYGASAGTPITVNATFASGVTTFTVGYTQDALGNIYVGSTITGDGIPSGATVTAVDYATNSITISDATTQANPLITSTTATFTALSPTIVVASATGIKAGSAVQGNGIQPGTVVSSLYTGGTTVPITAYTSDASPSTAITNATFSSGATSITVSSATDVFAGSVVSGYGIAAGTLVGSAYSTGSTTVPLTIATTLASPGTNVTTASFASGAGVITVTSSTGLAIGSYITGTGIQPGTQISSLYAGGTSVPITLSTTAASSGNYTFTTLSLVTFTTANNPYTFTTTSQYTFSTESSGWSISGGALIQNLTDPQLRGQVTRMMSANGYLYLFGKSSIFVISDVYIPSGAVPPSPVFSIVNVQALIGSNQINSVFPLDRQLMFANSYGLWALQGVSAVRVSEDIDGTIQWLDHNFPISGGTVEVWNQLNSAFLLKTVGNPSYYPSFPSGAVSLNPQTSANLNRVAIAMFLDKKWWFHYITDDAGNTPTFICGGLSGDIPSLFGFINNQLYQLLADYTSSPGCAWQTSLWAMEDSLADKEAFRIGFEVTSFTNGLPNLNFLTLDTPAGSSSINPTARIDQVTWVNYSLNVVSWINNSGQIVFWSGISYLLYVGGNAGGGYGKYVGISGNFFAGTPFAISSNAMDYTLRKRW